MARKRAENRYCTEVGVMYRHLKNDDQADSGAGETAHEYRSYYHRPRKDRPGPTDQEGGTIYTGVNRIAILRQGEMGMLRLLNWWNRQTQSGWTYYSDDIH